VVSVYRDLNGDGIPQPGELVATTLTAADALQLPEPGQWELPGGRDQSVWRDQRVRHPGFSDRRHYRGRHQRRMDSSGNNFLDDGATVTSIGATCTTTMVLASRAPAPLPPMTTRSRCGGRLYRDIDGDGVADADELVDTAVTDGTGAYSFSNLPTATTGSGDGHCSDRCDRPRWQRQHRRQDCGDLERYAEGQPGLPR